MVAVLPVEANLTTTRLRFPADSYDFYMDCPPRFPHHTPCDTLTGGEGMALCLHTSPGWAAVTPASPGCSHLPQLAPLSLAPRFPLASLLDPLFYSPPPGWPRSIP